MKRYRAYSTQIISALPADLKEELINYMLNQGMMPTRTDISLRLSGDCDPRYVRIVNISFYEPPLYSGEPAKEYTYCWPILQGKDVNLEAIAHDLRDFILNKEHDVWMLNQRGRITIDKRILEE